MGDYWECCFEYEPIGINEGKKSVKVEVLTDENIRGMYRHFKGKIYEVLGLVRHSETEEPMVLYQAPDGKKWVRPAAMFFESIERNGKMVKRFTKIEG